MTTSAIEMAEAKFRECQLCEEFLRTRIRPRLDHALAGTPSEKGQTYLGLFLRALAWLGTLRKLDRPSDFQAVIVASRTLFEIAIDVTIMHLDPLNPFAKLLAWEKSAKLKTAEQVVRHFAAQGKTPPDTFDPQLRHIKTEGPRVEALRLQYWPDGKGKGRHPRTRWTGRDLAKDARAATSLLPEGNFVEFYETRYPQICWNTHGSGLAGVRFLNEAQFPALSAIAFGECVHFSLVTGKLALVEFGMLDEKMTQEFDDLEVQRLFLKYVTLLAPKIVDALRQASSAPNPSTYFKARAVELRDDIAPFEHLSAGGEARIAAFIFPALAGLDLTATTLRECMRELPEPAARDGTSMLLGVLRALAEAMEKVP